MHSTLRILSAGATLGLTFASLASLSTPADTAGFSLTGDVLGLDQRDVRVLNNFSDPSANDNTTPHPDFPSVNGATRALWKAHLEWSSVPFAGSVHCEFQDMGGGLLAFVETPPSTAGRSTTRRRSPGRTARVTMGPVTCKASPRTRSVTPWVWAARSWAARR